MNPENNDNIPQQPLEQEEAELSVNPWREPVYRSMGEYRDPLYTPGVKYTAPSGRRARRRGGPGIVSAVLAVVLCVCLCAAAGASVSYAVIDRYYDAGYFRQVRNVVLGAEMSQPTDENDSGETDADDGRGLEAWEVYDIACQQVVGVTTTVQTANIFGQVSESAVTGSGLIISADGYILTNFHVIEYAATRGGSPTVFLYDGSRHTAEIVGTYEFNDIAVLKIDEQGLSAAQFGDSSQLSVGEKVYCVGNPLGELEFTMTSGIVSAKDRAITFSDGSVMKMLQLDAAVNSGNSGGPVYNDQGQVVGIVTAKYGSEGVEGLGFAIPAADAYEISQDLCRFGYVTGQAAMGIRVRTVSGVAAQYYHLHEGAYVDSVEAGSCSEKAGIQRGDIIVKMDDTEITTAEAWLYALRSFRAGDTVTVTLYRQGQDDPITVDVVLDEYVPAE